MALRKTATKSQFPFAYQDSEAEVNVEIFSLSLSLSLALNVPDLNDSSLALNRPHTVRLSLERDIGPSREQREEGGKEGRKERFEERVCFASNIFSNKTSVLVGFEEEGGGRDKSDS